MKSLPYGLAESIYSLPDDSLHGTDDANAALFLHLFGDNVRYNPGRDKWLIWNGAYWQYDGSLELLRMADLIPRALYHKASDMEAGKERNWITDLAKRLERNHARNGMLTAARHRVVVTDDDLDRDHFLLNCKNGTLDLRTGKLHQHDRADLLTHCNGISHDPDWVSWAWRRFLNSVFGDNDETINYIQRLVGYSLTGSTAEHIFMICWGNGANGKSVFLNTLRRLLGPLALHAMPDLLLLDQNRRHPTEQAELCGRRLVVCQETGDGRRFNEALVKNLTGGDPVTARRLYEEQFTFTPTHKIWLATNYRPMIKGTDHGIWRRVRLIPFEKQFTETSSPARDPRMEHQLSEELPGILNWAIEGCLMYLSAGLSTCNAVSSATATYQADMDVISGWIADCCSISPHHQCKADALYRSYQGWCHANGEAPETQKSWGGGLQERGLTRLRRKTGYFWLGVGLQDSTQYQEED